MISPDPNGARLENIWPKPTNAGEFSCEGMTHFIKPNPTTASTALICHGAPNKIDTMLNSLSFACRLAIVESNEFYIQMCAMLTD